VGCINNAVVLIIHAVIIFLYRFLARDLFHAVSKIAQHFTFKRIHPFHPCDPPSFAAQGSSLTVSAIASTT